MIKQITRHSITVGIVLTAMLGSSALAQATGNTGDVTTLPTNDWSFWPTDDDKAPSRTVSGGSRSGCSSEQFTALLPSSRYGLTRQSHPELLIATSTNTARQAMFSVHSDDDYYYETYIQLPATPGIIRIALPSDAPALAPNQLYQWSLLLMCNSRFGPDSPTIVGWIQTEPGADTATADISLQQATEYRDAHLWYDMIALLADLRQQEPHNEAVHQAWQSMLEGNDLAAIANAPILDE